MGVASTPPPLAGGGPVVGQSQQITASHAGNKVTGEEGVQGPATKVLRSEITPHSSVRGSVSRRQSEQGKLVF